MSCRRRVWSLTTWSSASLYRKFTCRCSHWGRAEYFRPSTLQEKLLWRLIYFVMFHFLFTETSNAFRAYFVPFFLQTGLNVLQCHIWVQNCLVEPDQDYIQTSLGSLYNVSRRWFYLLENSWRSLDQVWSWRQQMLLYCTRVKLEARGPKSSPMLHFIWSARAWKYLLQNF